MSPSPFGCDLVTSLISPVGLPSANNPAGVDPDLISRYLEKHASSLSKTDAQVMPNWIRTKFPDTENEHQRLVICNYQDHEQIIIRLTRSMDGFQLIDRIELPLKSFGNFNIALRLSPPQRLSDSSVSHAAASQQYARR